MAIRWRWWLMGSAGLAGLGLVTGMLVLSHDSPCGEAPAVGAGETMQAVAYRCYGSPEVLRLETLPIPVPGDGEVLVRVHAASVNPVDKHYLYGTPYVVRLSAGIGAPTVAGFGTDFSGTVAAVGAGVTRFKPESLGFDEAAAMPVAAITALQALRDKAKVAPGQKVLINGASGGVGTFAVQIAKALGAEVTGVCSTRNVELVRSLGADHVIDYTQEDFTQGQARFDAIIDMVGNHGIGALTGVIVPDGVLVRVGSTSYNPWLQPFASMAAVAVQSLLRSQRIEGILASIQPADLEHLAELAAAGKLKPVIDRRYPMAQTADAVRYLETGRARGKIIIDIGG